MAVQMTSPYGTVASVSDEKAAVLEANGWTRVEAAHGDKAEEPEDKPTVGGKRRKRESKEA